MHFGDNLSKPTSESKLEYCLRAIIFLLSLVSNIIGHNILLIHHSSAFFAPKPFFPTGGGDHILSEQERRKTLPDISSLTSKVNDFSTIIDIYVKPYLNNCSSNFVGGQLSTCFPKWNLLLSDLTILQTVKGKKYTS